jgi:hypothetical protein
MALLTMLPEPTVHGVRGTPDFAGNLDDGDTRVEDTGDGLLTYFCGIRKT